MDNDLLEKTAEPVNRLAEAVTNNEPEPEQAQYRELEVAPPQLPVRLKLEPPVEYDGKTYKEIVCDFEKMVGIDYIRAEREFRHGFRPATKNEIPFAQMNPEFHTILIAHASDVPTGVIKKLQIRQFTALQGEALKIFGSSPDEEKT